MNELAVQNPHHNWFQLNGELILDISLETSYNNLYNYHSFQIIIIIAQYANINTKSNKN